jgi:hypothetical protein
VVIIRARLVGLVAGLILACAPSAVGQEAERDFAHSVIVASASYSGGGYDFALDCWVNDGSKIDDYALFDVTYYDDGSTFPSMSTPPKGDRDSGRALLVHDMSVYEEGSPNGEGEPTSTFGLYGSPSAHDTGWAMVGVAVWDETDVTCQAAFDGNPAEVHYYPGSYAYYVDTTAFTGGAYMREGATQATVARYFRDDQLSGGPLVGRFTARDYDDGGRAAGVIITDDPYVYQPVRLGWGSFAADDPSWFTVATAAAIDVDGGVQGSLWVVNPPDDVRPARG